MSSADMTPRDRVLAVYRNQLPDRPPPKCNYLAVIFLGDWRP
jgi:hypothetical protein